MNTSLFAVRGAVWFLIAILTFVGIMDMIAILVAGPNLHQAGVAVLMFGVSGLLIKFGLPNS